MKELLDLINQKYTLQKKDAGEFAKMKVSGMTFDISAYDAKGLGSVSVMTAKMPLGIMKMDTLIITPVEMDLPLFSYDRILALGNDTFYMEFYDTVVGSFDASALDEVKKKYAHIPDHMPAPNWYDDIRLPQSIFKKTKKNPELDTAIVEYLKAYLESKAEKTADTDAKRKKNEDYVYGLIKNGGPSTNVFVKKYGPEKTSELFEKVLFGLK